MKYLTCQMSLLLVTGTMSLAHAQCWVEDETFANADGGCKDFTTGLVWSADSRGIFDRETYGNTNSDEYYALALNDIGYGGYTDWRLPTIAEVESSILNGLNAHLDFFLDGGATPDDDKYRWVADQEKYRGTYKRYSIRFFDRDVMLELSASHPISWVRGGLPEEPRPGNGNGKGKNATSSTTVGVPEPSSLLLGGIAVAGVGMVGRRSCHQ